MDLIWDALTQLLCTTGTLGLWYWLIQTLIQFAPLINLHSLFLKGDETESYILISLYV